MRVLLTGSTGLLGHNILKVLIDRHFHVNVIVRDEKKLLIKNDDVRIFKGSFLSFEDLNAAASGCDAIIHAAAATDMSLDFQEFERVIVGGAKNIIEVAKTNKINKIVFISSANTIGYGTKNHLSDENDQMEFPFSDSYYAQTKKIAEDIFIDFSKNSSLLPPLSSLNQNHIVILNPGFMLGSYDTKPSSGQLVKAAHRKPVMFAPKGGKSFIHVGDVATAAVNALEMGRNGERYICANYNMTIKDFYKLLAKTFGYRQLLFSIPNSLMSLVGFFGDGLRKIGIKTQVSTVNVRQLCVTEHYSSAKAREELGLPETPLETAIEDCVKFLFKRCNENQNQTLDRKL